MTNLKYKPRGSTRWDTNRDCFKINWNELQRLDELAKANNQLEGRYIQGPFADGYAIYQIVRENKKTVRIEHCRGLGDDWVIPYWGEKASIDINYARQRISSRDWWAKVSSQQNKKSDT